MKIAVLTSGILPVPAVLGGAVENLIDYYLEYNKQHQLHDMTVYSIAPPTPVADSPSVHYHHIDTHTWWGRLKRYVYVRTHSAAYYNAYIEYFFQQALKDIARKEYDIIILENRPGFAIPVSKVSKAKIILHLHNDLLNKDSRDAKEICSVCHKVITVSNYIKSWVETIGADIPVETVYNGIDLERFYHAKPVNKASLGFIDSNFIVVYSGRIIKEKGIEELIDAFTLLKEQINIKLLILGSDFYGTGKMNDPFIKRLKAKCQSIRSAVTFTGFIPYNQIPQYLKIGDIAVVPSLWEEPFGLTCIEAMAAGLPLITTNSGAIPEICKNAAYIIDKDNLCEHLYHQILISYENNIVRKIPTHLNTFSKEIYSMKFLTALE